MFENLTPTSIIIYVVLFLASKWLVPKLVQQPGVKKAVRVIDRNIDYVDSADAEFDWKHAEAKKYRPFKSVYYVTMGLSRVNQNDWLSLEKTYDRATNYRIETAKERPDETCLIATEKDTSKKIAQATEKAVEELYDEVISFMLAKYPMYFVATGNVVTNLIKNTELPRRAKKRSKDITARDLLKILCENVEEDFLLLQFDPEKGEYVLRGLTGIGANGFRSSEKMGKQLTDIHQPVPQYIARLQLSMNKSFHRLPVGEYLQRLTWGVQVGGDEDSVFRPSGNHLSSDEKVDEVLKRKDLDFGNGVFLRVERQVLSRLKESQFIVLSVRTLMYPVAEIKQEGLGLEMAKAIRAWPEDTGHYKGRPRWGPAVLEYLEEGEKK